MVRCNPHHSQSSAGVNLAEQAGTKSQPRPTGCEVCKEGKPRLWESRALQPNDEMIQNVPLLSTGFQTGNLFSSRWFPGGQGLCGAWTTLGPGRAASTGTQHCPRAPQPGAGLTEEFLSCPTPPGPADPGEHREEEKESERGAGTR